MPIFHLAWFLNLQEGAPVFRLLNASSTGRLFIQKQKKQKIHFTEINILIHKTKNNKVII